MTRINRRSIARLLREERRDNVLARYPNHELRARLYANVFGAYAWPGGYTVEFITDDGSVLCADCARAEVLENRGTVYADIYYEGPTRYCDGCNTAIESAYGDPDAEEEEEETEPRCTCYGINIHDATCPLWEDPRTADEIAGMHVFNG